MSDTAANLSLLRPNPHKYVLFPIEYPKIYEMYEKAEASFWTVHEIDLFGDKKDWDALPENEKHILKNVFAFFAASDGPINENLVRNFYEEIEVAEARMFLGMQICIENIHSKTYSTLIDTYVENADERMKLFKSMETMPNVTEKTRWAIKYIKRDDITFTERLAICLFIEGLFFSSAFAFIFLFKKRGTFPGLVQANMLISRDEGMHAEFSALLFNICRDELKRDPVSVEWIHAMARDAVEVEKRFVKDTLPDGVIGLKQHEMITYVEFCADRLLRMIGYPTLWNVQCPLDYMTLISLEPKQNFFERKVTQYVKAGVKPVESFNTNADF